MPVTTVRGLDGLGRSIAKSCAQFSTELPVIEKAGTKAVGASVVAAVAANLGGPRIRLSGVGKKGANVSVVAFPRGDTVVVKMNGPAHLIERDTKAHQIPKTRKRSRRGRPNALRIGNQWVTGPISHPGTEGKHPFERGVNTARVLAPKVYQRGVQVGLRKAFK